MIFNAASLKGCRILETHFNNDGCIYMGGGGQTTMPRYPGEVILGAISLKTLVMTPRDES